MIFAIVTPTFQGARFLRETLESVLRQEGDFELRYHVQDGGSSDETVTVLKEYETRISRGEFSGGKQSVHFSWASEKDAGMYDAINRGFTRIDGDVLAWINSDDVYMPGALSVIVRVFTEFPGLNWVKGITRYIDESSAVISMGRCFIYDRHWIGRGVYGNEGYFIEQDSVFWRKSLWQIVGPIDSTLQVAGDFALWVGFSRHSSLASISENVSAFRKVSGQLSQDLSRYRTEMRRVVPEDRRKYGWIRQFFRVGLKDPTFISQIAYRIFGREKAILIRRDARGKFVIDLTRKFSVPAPKA